VKTKKNSAIITSGAFCGHHKQIKCSVYCLVMNAK